MHLGDTPQIEDVRHEMESLQRGPVLWKRRIRSAQGVDTFEVIETRFGMSRPQRHAPESVSSVRRKHAGRFPVHRRAEHTRLSKVSNEWCFVTGSRYPRNNTGFQQSWRVVGTLIATFRCRRGNLWSAFRPRDGSECIGLAVSCNVVVFAAPGLNSGPVS
jgi:hypothetical protein